MNPVYDRDGITVYLGDCRDVLPTLDAVDHVITDPPYNVSEEDSDIRHVGTGELAQRRDFGEWDRDEWHPGELLAEAHRLMRKGGSLLAFTSDRLLSAYRTNPGFAPRGTIVWEKTNPPPTPRPAYVSATEWIVWLQKPGSRAVWNGSGFTINLLRYPICGGAERAGHPTQKPEALIRELIERHTDPGDVILDPFGGSLTTAVACKQLGRRCITVELDEGYVQAGIKRLEATTLPLFVLAPEKPVQEGLAL